MKKGIFKKDKLPRVLMKKMGKRVVFRSIFSIFVLFAILFSFNFVSAEITCATGTVDTTCNLNSTYYFIDGEIISGSGNLIINSTGSIANYSTNVSGTNHGAGVLLNFTTITILNLGNISGANITIIANNLIIFADGKLDTSYRGYYGGMGPGRGSTGSGRGSGAGHGNNGGNSNDYYPGIPYGSSLSPNTFGSGGGYYSGNFFGGSGGGIIRIDSSNITLNGQILANGQSAFGSYAGAGSGGSIWITTNNFSGNGYVQSNGGNGRWGSSGDYGGGGSGGRIAIYYNQSNWTGLTTSTVTGGTASGNYGKAEPGTFIFSKQNDNTAIISEGFRFENDSTIANETQTTTFYNIANPSYYNFTNLTIVYPTGIASSYIFINGENIVINVTNVFNNESLKLMITNSIFNSTSNYILDFPRYNSLYLNNSVLRTRNNLKSISLPFLTNFLNLENSAIYSNLILSLQNLSIDHNSKLDASYLGYVMNSGPGTGTSGGGRASGAGHGNNGGNSNDYYPGIPYGSSLSPNTFGSGGGYLSGNLFGGSGGGVIKINSPYVLLNGQIVTNGQSAFGSYAGGGSGGSIWITTNNFSGNGYVQSNGGNGRWASSGDYGGGGSGGRIAIYYNESNWTGLTTSTVTGGTASGNYGKAEPGTFILSKLNDNTAIISEGFRFENTSTIANETISTSFYSTVNQNYYNFTNLTIVYPTGIPSSYIFINGENIIINVTNVFNQDTSKVVINNTIFNSTCNYTLDFPRYNSVYLLNSVLRSRNNLRFIFLPFLNNILILENSAIYSNLILSLQNLSIDVNSKLDSSYVGYAMLLGPGGGISGGGRGSGAGHGNNGGSSSTYLGGIAYGSSLSPNTFGSGGGYLGGYPYAGSGGGIIKINSPNITLNGQILANGQSNFGSYAAGGSGGSIWITTNYLYGNGYLGSTGGNAAFLNTGDYSGGGSGGRIAIYYNESNWTGLASSLVTGGSSSGFYGKAEPGTFIFAKLTDNTAVISEGFRFQNTSTMSNETRGTSFYNLVNPNYYNFTNLTIVNPTGVGNSYIYINSENMVINVTNVFNQDTNAVMITNSIFNSSSNYTLDFPRYNSLYMFNSTLRTKNNLRFITLPFLTNYLTLENSSIYSNLILSLQNLNVDANSRLDASYIGYAMLLGPGAGVTGGRGNGAGHASIGGASSNFAGGVTYGSPLSPFTFGSGGGYLGGYPYAGSGGGIIKINSPNITLNGQILANGQSNFGSYAAGGSGGSIWITTNYLYGNGYLQSNGGNAAFLNTGDYCGGGSGGRIAIYYNQSNWMGLALSTLTGGTASGNYGRALGGTLIYLQTALGDYSFLNSPANNSGFKNSFEANLSIIKENIQNLTYGWNGTSYLIYDRNILYLGFNNLSSLFENDNRIEDAGVYDNIAGAGRNYTSVERIFNFDNYGVQNWTMVNLSLQPRTRGFFEIGLTSVLNPSISQNITDFNSTKNNFEIKYKSYPTGPNTIKLYYIDNADCVAYGETCAQSFNIDNDGQWHLLNAPITDTSWIDNDGLIDQIKLNFNGASSTLGAFYLDNIRFYQNSSTEVVPVVVDGKYGGARQFDGINDYLELENHFSLNFKSSDFTILAWLKLNNTGLNYLLDKGNVTDRYAIYINNSKLNFQFRVNNFNITTSDAGNSLSDNVWHQVAIVFQRNGNAIRYLDGSQIATTDISGNQGIQNDPSSLFIGRSIYENGFFNGTVDELYIFNRTLSAGDISNFYNSNFYKYNETTWYFYKNQTAAQGIYQYSISSGSESFNVDGSQQRRVILDFTNPNITGLSILNNSYFRNNSVNFTASASDNLLISNVSFYLNGVLNQTVNYLQDVTITPVEIVVSLVDGIYNWFFNIFDLAGNFFNTVSRVTIIDTINPLINFTDPTPEDQAGRSREFTINTTIIEKNFANVSYLWNGTIRYFNQTNESLIQVDNQTWIFTYTQKGLIPGNTYSYQVGITDLAANFNSTEIRMIGANLAPVFIYVRQTPELNGSIDPGSEVNVSVNISDSDYNIDSVYLEWKGPSQNWNESTRIKLENNTIIYTPDNSISPSTIFNGSFILPISESIITYRLVANDTLGDSKNSSEYALAASWDCSWSVSPLALNEVSGFYQDKIIGEITLFNTGDGDYPTNCTLTFSLSRTSFNSDYNDLVSDDGKWYSSRRYLDFNRTITLNAGENQTVSILASFPIVTSALSIQNPTIEILSKKNGSIFNDSVDNVNTRKVATTLFVLPSGPYLYLNSVNSSITVYLTDQESNLSAYLRNMGGDGSLQNTAFNVSVNWSIPDLFTLSGGNKNYSFENVTNNSIFEYMNITLRPNVGMLEGASLASQQINISAQGYNYSGGLIYHYGNLTMINDTILVNFACYPIKDDICVNACINLTEGLVYDPDCSIPTTTTTVTLAGGAGGGSGGSVGGATVIKSEANYELLRGGKQNFQLEIKNKYGDEMRNIKILVSGLNSEYISIVPDSIASLAPGETRNVTVTISAPGYFSGKKYDLIFDITGGLVSNATSGESTIVTDKRYVTLYIVEVDRKDAILNINDSTLLIEEMNASGLITKEVRSLLVNQNKAYEELNFLGVKNIYEQIKKIKDNAFESKQLIEEITASIAESEKNGITIIESKKSLYLAQVAFNRGDYALALERLKEAKLVYALEVKGELNLIYTIKNNPGKSFSIAIFAGLFGWSSSLLIRSRLYKRKLKSLGEEEILLLELMKMVQRQCFEEKRMSMEEYNQAMMQYESKLSETIEDKIRTETKMANLLRVRGKRKALDQEKSRLIELIRKVQDDYLNKNKIETRIYEGMIKSYSSRLTEVDEQLAYVEAQDALKKQTKINGLFKI